MTLVDLFSDLEGRTFGSRRELEQAVVDALNRHVGSLPIGYSYKDAIDGARERGWLRTNGGAHGVQIELPDGAAASAAV